MSSPPLLTPYDSAGARGVLFTLSSEAELSALVEAQCQLTMNVRPERTGTIRLVPVEALIANPEPTFSVVAGVPRFLEDFVGQTRAGRAFTAALGQVDEAEDVATALQRVREAEATIQSFAREPTRRAPSAECVRGVTGRCSRGP